MYLDDEQNDRVFRVPVCRIAVFEYATCIFPVSLPCIAFRLSSKDQVPCGTALSELVGVAAPVTVRVTLRVMTSVTVAVAMFVRDIVVLRSIICHPIDLEAGHSSPLESDDRPGAGVCQTVTTRGHV